MLAEVLRSEMPSLVFLSEPQVFQSDIQNTAQYFQPDYCYFLNSEDSNDPDLPLVSSKAKGGTMILWRKYLDPFIKVVNVNSSAFLPIVISIPGSRTSVHVALYLPTHGQDTEFVSELANLRNCLDDLITEYGNPCIYIRGDGNVNIKNTNRVNILSSFKTHFDLNETEILHKTYHHFVGHGLYDSNVDVILHSRGSKVSPEAIMGILCQKNNPAMYSHHDIILSTFSLPPGDKEQSAGDLVSAPRMNHQRNKVIWTEEGIEKYSALVSTHLRRIRDTWLDPQSQASMSVLLQLTNSMLSKAASDTNESKVLNSKVTPRRKKIPQPILIAQRKLNKANKKLMSSNTVSGSKHLKQCRKSYHQAVRKFNLQSDLQRDSQLFGVLGEHPTKVFSLIKSFKNTQTGSIAKLTVGKKTYHGDNVPDGFYDSMSSLKQCDFQSLKKSPELAGKLLDYETIIDICQTNHGLQAIDIDASTKLLHKIKKNVKDHYSITAQHYLNAGQEGLKHFNFLLNGVIGDLNNAGLEELNTAHGLIFYKGHRKDKTSDRSYRTISSCPFLAKSLDMYIRDLYLDLWQDQEAETQYQGTGSSHELASLLITEVIQHSLFVSKQPVYLLALDAQSAFDRCLRQVLVSELFKAKVPAAAIILIDKRLASRTTVYEWEGEVMGPAKDGTGFEQGGINSSDFYKLYNNEQLKSAQDSKLGVDIESQVISGVGQADDVMLASSSLYNLQLLVALTEQYCAKFRVKLEPSKTKLLVYYPPSQSFIVDHAMNSQQITIDNTPVSQVAEAEHVGVLRNTAGNLPHIANRIAMHKNSLHALLPAGLARRHRGNPAASLKLSQLYGVPVLLSGVASLVLNQAELNILEGHYLLTLQSLLRIHEKTPRSMVYFLAGSLPVTALLHQRQLSLFAMVCHLKDDPLNHHARHVLLHSQRCSQSWFVQVKDICLLYGLPHPLHLLNSPPTKLKLRKVVKTKITEYWQHFLASEAMPLPSLSHFNPAMHSLVTPHPMWAAAGSSAYEVNKTTILARMISGRYRTESLCRFWSDNRQGYCLATTCSQTVGDLEHLLLHCPALQLVRNSIIDMWLKRCASVPDLQTMVLCVLASSAQKRMSFILDPSSMPEIVDLYQKHGMAVLDIVFHMTRTYAYGLHRKQLILRGKWPFSMKGENYCLNDQTYNLSVSGPTAMSLDACCEPLPTNTIARRPEVCCVPPHHASPASTATSGQGRLTNHTMPNQSSGCLSVAIMHHHIPVHAQQAHDMPVDSVRCADGDSELESSVTSGVAVDRLATLTTYSN